MMSCTGAPIALCAHCALPVLGRGRREEPSYCCSGCAIAHRIAGGADGHGRAAGLLMAVGIGSFLSMNVMMLSFILYTGTAEADRGAGEAWVRWALLLLATLAMLLLGPPFLARGLRRLREGSLDTDTLVVCGVGAAYALSARSVLRGSGPVYLDTAVGILLFVTIGRYLEAACRARTTDALAALARQLPEQAARVTANGEERVAVAELRLGDLVRVRPGERFAVDGVVAEGEGSVSQAEVTGEPLPARRGASDRIAAGTLNLDGSFLVRVEGTGPDTLLARLAVLVEQARAGGYPLAPIVDRVARLFVPVVLLAALVTAVFWTALEGLDRGVLNALSVLLIACPCAIGIAVPLASTTAAGRAARAGVLVRSGEVFERLASSRRVFLDKTGTLSRGTPDLVSLQPAPAICEDELLRAAAALETHSEHPFGRAICSAAAARGLEAQAVEGFRAVPGQGVTALIAGRLVRLGTREFADGRSVQADAGSSVVHLSVDGRWHGAFVFRDRLRATSAAAVAGLQARGLAVEILSGDRAEAVAALQSVLPDVITSSGQSPEDKLARVRQAVGAGEVPIMVGDGINDAPALSGAAVGVTLCSGTDLARETADVTLMSGDLQPLPWLVGLARRTLAVARFNLFWAFSYNSVGIVLAMQGRLHPLFGAAAMIASSLLVVLNSQRLARYEATA